MYLIIGKTYTALHCQGKIIRFKFEGCDENGTVIIEIPPGSGERVRFESVFPSPGSWLCYWLLAENHQG